MTFGELIASFKSTQADQQSKDAAAIAADTLAAQTQGKTAAALHAGPPVVDALATGGPVIYTSPDGVHVVSVPALGLDAPVPDDPNANPGGTGATVTVTGPGT